MRPCEANEVRFAVGMHRPCPSPTLRRQPSPRRAAAARSVRTGIFRFNVGSLQVLPVAQRSVARNGRGPGWIGAPASSRLSRPTTGRWRSGPREPRSRKPSTPRAAAATSSPRRRRRRASRLVGGTRGARSLGRPSDPGTETRRRVAAATCDPFFQLPPYIGNKQHGRRFVPSAGRRGRSPARP